MENKLNSEYFITNSGEKSLPKIELRVSDNRHTLSFFTRICLQKPDAKREFSKCLVANVHCMILLVAEY